MRNFELSVDVGESYNDPMRFVESCQVAEKSGFRSVWFGDHFLPWVHSNARSAFVWSVMPTALDRTKKLKIGTNVTTPIGGRFHPAIIAQAAATLDNMYPGRFLLGVGSGEAMNESRFFPSGWPRWQERIERLSEAVVLMRKLWSSREFFDFEGRYFKMNKLYLYTKPKSKIPVYFSAIGKKAASYAGTYGDHLITTGNSPARCRNVIFPAFEESARKAGKNPSKMQKMVHFQLYLTSKKAGLNRMRRTGEGGIVAKGAYDEPDPRKIMTMVSQVSDEKILDRFQFISSADEVIEIIESFRKVGATRVNVCTHSYPDRIRYLGKKVLPYFNRGQKR